MNGDLKFFHALHGVVDCYEQSVRRPASVPRRASPRCEQIGGVRCGGSTCPRATSACHRRQIAR